MTFRTALRQYIAGDGGITAIVGSRIFPDRLPPRAIMPALTFNRVTQRDHPKVPDYVTAMWQITGYDDDDDPAVLDALEDAVLDRLNRLEFATMTDGTNTFSIVRINHESTVPTIDPTTEYRLIAMTFEIRYRK